MLLLRGLAPRSPTNVTDADPDPAVLKTTYSFSGCTPEGLSAPVRGVLSVAQQVLKTDAQGNATNFAQDYTYSNLSFEGHTLNGRLRIVAVQTYGSGTEALTSHETYDLSALKIDGATFNGRQVFDLKQNGDYGSLLTTTVANASGPSQVLPHTLCR